MSKRRQSGKGDVLSGYLAERLTRLLRDIVDVVEDAVSEYRDETLRTRLENEQLRRQLGDFLGPGSWLPATSKRLAVRNPKKVCAPDRVKAPVLSTPERASASLLVRPDRTPILPALLGEPVATPSPTVKIEQENSHVTPIKSDPRIDSLKNVGRREVERNGHIGETSAEGGVAYECPRCGQVFSQACRLRLHLEQKRKSYACERCCKSFAQSADLRRHVRTHTGERPHRCSFCAKSFSQRGNLRRHVRIHTGERPYRCAACRRTFSDGDTLKKHARTHRKADEVKVEACRNGTT
ncbi:uncharacterized protein LOC144088356 [Stigmatopora argus]